MTFAGTQLNRPDTDVAQCIATMRKVLSGHIPDDALACFIALAQAKRGMRAWESNHRYIWLEDTRYTAQDICSLWPVVTMEEGRPYLIPPKAFAAWLHTLMATDVQWVRFSGKTFAYMYLSQAGKGNWQLDTQVIRNADNDAITITPTPFEASLAYCGGISTPEEMTWMVKSILSHLQNLGYVPEAQG